jgi:acetylglutamate kinase
LTPGKLVLLTDTQGCSMNRGAHFHPQNGRSAENISDGTIKGGHDPQGELLPGGAQGRGQKTHIIDGREPHAILLEILTKDRCGD